MKIFRMIVLGAVVISFAFWGVAGTFFGSNDQNVAVQVGDTQISVTDITERVRSQAQRFGITLQSMGPDLGETLIQLAIDEASWNVVLAQEAERLGIVVSPQDVQSIVTASPSFYTDGQFDKSLLQDFLARSRLTEQQFIESQQQDIAVTLLQSMVRLPQHEGRLQNSIAQYIFAERSFDILSFPIQEAKIPPPSFPDESLKAYLESHSDQFQTRERRQVTVVAVEQSNIVDNIDITSQDIQTYYQKEIARYTNRAVRVLEQVRFADVDAAAKAREQWLKGEKSSLKDLEGAQAQGATNLELKRSGAVDTNPLTNAAFSLDENNSVSEPLDTPFGTILLRFIEEKPQTLEPLDTVRQSIVATLTEQRLDTAIKDIQIQLEDGLADGTSLREVAEDLSLGAVTLWLDPDPNQDATEAAKRSASVDAVLTSPGLALTLRSMDKGDSSRLISATVDNSSVNSGNTNTTTDDGGDSQERVWGMVEVVDVVPSRVMTLEEARPSLRLAVDREQRMDQMRTRIEDLREKAKNTADWVTLARAHSADLNTSLYRIENIVREQQAQMSEATITQRWPLLSKDSKDQKASSGAPSGNNANASASNNGNDNDNDNSANISKSTSIQEGQEAQDEGVVEESPDTSNKSSAPSDQEIDQETPIWVTQALSDDRRAKAFALGADEVMAFVISDRGFVVRVSPTTSAVGGSIAKTPQVNGSSVDDPSMTLTEAQQKSVAAGYQSQMRQMLSRAMRRNLLLSADIVINDDALAPLRDEIGRSS